jgi:drug/metabolite transporter superfamily protein YnfA
MEMAKRKKKAIFWPDWRSHPISIQNIPTIQPSNFGRVYAAYGGIFVVSAIIWGLIDKKRPDRYEIIGGLIVLLGASVIFYYPRWIISTFFH